MAIAVMAVAALFKKALLAAWDDNVPRLGASLAYYTLFAIAPILLVATAVAGLAFGAEAVRGELAGQLAALVGPDGAKAIQGLLQGASQRQTGIVASILGGATFVLAATGAFLELQAALNTIWRVKPSPSVNIRAFFLDRLRSFGLVVAIGFLLLVSLTVSAALAAFGAWLERRAPGVPLLLNVLNLALGLALTTGLFALLLQFVPDVDLTWRDVGVGAFMTAVLFTTGQQLIGFYLGHSGTASSYGAAGSVIVLLLWVYYSSQIVLLGAEFTRAYADARGHRPPPRSFAEHEAEAQTPARASRR